MEEFTYKRISFCHKSYLTSNVLLLLIILVLTSCKIPVVSSDGNEDEASPASQAPIPTPTPTPYIRPQVTLPESTEIRIYTNDYVEIDHNNLHLSTPVSPRIRIIGEPFEAVGIEAEDIEVKVYVAYYYEYYGEMQTAIIDDIHLYTGNYMLIPIPTDSYYKGKKLKICYKGYSEKVFWIPEKCSENYFHFDDRLPQNVTPEVTSFQNSVAEISWTPSTHTSGISSYEILVMLGEEILRTFETTETSIVISSVDFDYNQAYSFAVQPISASGIRGDYNLTSHTYELTDDIYTVSFSWIIWQENPNDESAIVKAPCFATATLSYNQAVSMMQNYNASYITVNGFSINISYPYSQTVTFGGCVITYNVPPNVSRLNETWYRGGEFCPPYPDYLVGECGEWGYSN